eukprot:4797474-Prymnesium_polylepis.1
MMVTTWLSLGIAAIAPSMLDAAAATAAVISLRRGSAPETRGVPTRRQALQSRSDQKIHVSFLKCAALVSNHSRHRPGPADKRAGSGAVNPSTRTGQQ